MRKNLFNVAFDGIESFSANRVSFYDDQLLITFLGTDVGILAVKLPKKIAIRFLNTKGDIVLTLDFFAKTPPTVHSFECDWSANNELVELTLKFETDTLIFK